MRRSTSTSELLSDSKRIDYEIKQVHKQIALAEKTYANLIKDLTNILVDLSRLKTREVEFNQMLFMLANEESATLKKAFCDVSLYLNNVKDALTQHIEISEKKVLQDITDAMKQCKLKRDDLEQCSLASKKRAQAVKNLEKAQKLKSKKTTNDELSKANITIHETTKQINDLENEMCDFERAKAENLKSVLKQYLHSSLAYHVKAIEHTTKAYQALSQIDIDKHIQDFNMKLFPSQQNSRVEFVRWNSFSSLKGNH